MSTLQVVQSLIVKIIQHPSSQVVFKHLVRVATAELVRHVQRKTRTSRSSAF